MDGVPPAEEIRIAAKNNSGFLVGRNDGLINVYVGRKDEDQHRVCQDALLNDPEIDRGKLVRVKGKRVPGTCEWIRENQSCRSWLDSRTHLLWISGGPGKGKTMLSIFLTEMLEMLAQEKPSISVIYYFSSHDDSNRNTAAAILRGLLFLLIKQQPCLAKYAYPYLRSAKRSKNTLSSLDTLWLIFERVLRDPALENVFCVLDGLDECDEASAGWLLGYFVPHIKSAAGRFRLAVLSREMVGLQSFTRLNLDHDNDMQLSNDIEEYIADGVTKLYHIQGFQNIESFVYNTLREKSDGTFLWVSFIMKELSKKKTSAEVLEAIDGLPKDLSLIYSRILKQIPPQQRDSCAQLLRWTTVAVRPLLLEELQELRKLAKSCSKPSNSLINDGQACREQIIHCGHLLKIHEEAVSLVHQSARDYLLQERSHLLESFHISPEEAHFELAKYCLDCIEQSSIQHEILDINDQSPRESPFLSYAVLHWPEHTRYSSKYANQILDHSRPFFQQNSPLGLNWWQTYCKAREPGVEDQQSPQRKVSWLHIAAYFGIKQWVEKILVNKSWKFWSRKLTERDCQGRTALLSAASGGHQEMVKLLLHHGADPDAKDSQGGTTLMWAAARGHQTVVELLFSLKIDVNMQDRRKETALFKAAGQGHRDIVQQLMAHDACVDLRDVREREPLALAADQGHEAVVRLLLDKGSKVNAQDIWGRTALMRATQNGHEKTVQALLALGADVDIDDNNNQTALMLAAEGGHKTVAQQLLDHGADIDRQGHGGRTALMWATEGDREQKAVVGVLLNHRASVNTQDAIDGRTALMRAVLQSHTAVITLLLNAGADVNVRDEVGVTPLMLAAEGGSEALARQLLDHGADVNAQDRLQKQTALIRAIERGNERLMKLLLDNGADVNTKYTRQDKTALMWAAEHGRQGMIRLLLEHGADIDARDWASQTALMRAVDRDQEATVQLLLDNEVDINVTSWEEGTALMRSVRRGNEAIAELLLKSGADINMKDELKGRNALMVAVEKDHEPIVRLLLDHGANINTCSHGGDTALMKAADRGNMRVRQLLLDHDAAVDTTDSQGQNARMKAFERGHTSVTALLTSAQESRQ